MIKREVLVGTWEEISRRANEFAGRRVRLELLPEEQINGGSPAAFYETATPEEWVAEFTAWAHTPRNAPLLSDEDISRDSIYGERLDRQL